MLYKESIDIDIPLVSSQFSGEGKETFPDKLLSPSDLSDGPPVVEVPPVGKKSGPLPVGLLVDSWSDSDIELLLSRFLNQPVGYYRQVAYPRFKYEAIHEPVMAELIRQHLAGSITIALPAVSRDGSSKWCCFDFDKELGDLVKVKTTLDRNGWHSLHEGKRPGREGHLLLFFDKPVSAADLILFGQEIIAQSGVSQDLEFFPKQEMPTTLGNPIRLPLGIHRKVDANNQRIWFEGPERDIDSQLAWFASQPLNDSKALAVIADQIRQCEKLKLRPIRAPRASESIDRVVTPILDLIPAFKRRLVGGQWITQCPVCAEEGHDRSEDNLRISGDGIKFCCWFGGQPGRVHTAAEIIKRLTSGGG